jgi:hypothetical protein
MSVGKIQRLTLEEWIQDSNPATWTPVRVEKVIGYDPSHRGSKSFLDMCGILMSTKSLRQEKRRGHERCFGVTWLGLVGTYLAG